MGTYFTAAKIRELLVKANPHELVYLALGYYIGAHYSKQVVTFMIPFLGGQ